MWLIKRDYLFFFFAFFLVVLLAFLFDVFFFAIFLHTSFVRLNKAIFVYKFIAKIFLKLFLIFEKFFFGEMQKRPGLDSNQRPHGFSMPNFNT